MFKIEKAINSLLNTNQFYAEFFLQCKIRYTLKDCPTMGVCINKSGVSMIINPSFVETLSDQETVAVIQHEIMHVIFEHCSVFALKKSDINKQKANVAMDLAINQYIKNLPAMGLFLDSFNKKYNLNMLPHMDWTYYYQNIPDDNSDQSLDDHGLQLEDLPPDLQQAIVKDIIEKSVTNAKGNVPNEIKKMVDQLLSAPKISWKSVLKNFVSKSISITKKNTRKKIHRRYDLDQPGIKKDRELVLGVCVDTSGSISDEQYMMFLSEISEISKITLATHIIEADCVVQNIQTVKKGKKIHLERNGNGGTAYQPAIDAAKKLKCDAIIYMGDADTADDPQDPRIPFLWVIVGNQDKPGNFGSVVRLT